MLIYTLSTYKVQIRPSLVYCSHIWGAAARTPTTLPILDAVQRRAIRLIGDPALTCYLQPLSPACSLHTFQAYVKERHFQNLLQSSSHYSPERRRPTVTMQGKGSRRLQDDFLAGRRDSECDKLNSVY
nr:unnamed protein product [Callosobruchus chinensis]